MRHAGQQRLSQKTYDASRYQFIMTELDLAITFSQISLTTGDSERANRNVAHADRAYSMALHFLKGARLTPEMVRNVNEMRTQLNPLLKRLRHDSGKAKASPKHPRTNH